MFSIQQLMNALRRLQVTNNGNSLPITGRNELFKNLKHAIDAVIAQAGNEQGAITQNPTVRKTTTTTTTTRNDCNNQELNVQIERELRELKENIQSSLLLCSSSSSSSLSPLTSLSASLSTLVMALTTATSPNGSEESKILLNNKNCLKHSKSNNNNDSNNNNNINDYSSQLTSKSRSMAINEIKAAAAEAADKAREASQAAALSAPTAAVEAVANNERTINSIGRPFSRNLYMRESGSICLNPRQQHSYQSEQINCEKKFHENCLNQIQINGEGELEAKIEKKYAKNFIDDYQNNRQHPQVTTTTATAAITTTTFSQSIHNFYQQQLHQKQQQQQQQQQQQHKYQKQYFHTKNPNSMNNNQNINMNDEQQQKQNPNELFKVMAAASMTTGLRQQGLHNYEAAPAADAASVTSAAADSAFFCNNLNSDNSIPTTTTTTTKTSSSLNKSLDKSSATMATTNTATGTASGVSCRSHNDATGKPCFNTGLSDILKFMELIGNLKHTKRTGWVLRDVNDCESISGHMYRMSILTFLLDSSEGLNQTRCMELALVHDLAESLVGDITPFCGVSKVDKRAMEFKAMEDICKLIEPRGKRIMELFEEYELGESPESQFVKDLDRLDMVMQAFEYEKRDNCLLKHQEFFDSTAGKFKHPFVKKLVNEIYEQRNKLATAKGAILPPKIHVPNMELKATTRNNSSNGHYISTSRITTTPTPTGTTGSTSNSSKS